MANQNPNRPTHRLYSVKGEGDKASWIAIGAAWQHQDGQGYTLSLEAVPLNGRITMREIAEREEGGQL